MAKKMTLVVMMIITITKVSNEHEEQIYTKLVIVVFFTLIDVQRMMVYMDKEASEKRPIMPDSMTPSMHWS